MTDTPQVGDVLEASDPIKAAHVEADTQHGIAGSFIVRDVTKLEDGTVSLTLEDSRLETDEAFADHDPAVHTYTAAWPFEALDAAKPEA